MAKVEMTDGSIPADIKELPVAAGLSRFLIIHMDPSSAPGPLCLLVKLEKIHLHGFQERGKEQQALADGAQSPSEHTSPEGEGKSPQGIQSERYPFTSHVIAMNSCDKTTVSNCIPLEMETTAGCLGPWFSLEQPILDPKDLS
ncbi:hypothetical protein HGM15179_014065 [Zosterops borbonicus]|uniref:Uncharacterized protein n=1 Tax=Zosterops borbonicus TaxID=364589 RepID=A0A8K1G6W5_9PASS|nr:hypothetical protein HGM15179_014065 [Zosterops borbonicus]